MKNNFNLVAPVYDQLVQLVFGDSLKTAQLHFIDLLPKNANVLIIGGGTGWILTSILERGFHGHITYLEASEKMIQLARKKVENNEKVRFIHGKEDSIPETETYDVVITNFFLDVFAAERLQLIFHTLEAKLKEEGLWFCTDFRNSDRPRHKILIWTMHRFFRYFSNLDAGSLLNFEAYFKTCGLSRIQYKEFRNGLIFSSIYQRQ